MVYVLKENGYEERKEQMGFSFKLSDSKVRRRECCFKIISKHVWRRVETKI